MYSMYSMHWLHLVRSVRLLLSMQPVLPQQWSSVWPTLRRRVRWQARRYQWHQCCWPCHYRYHGNRSRTSLNP